MVRNDVRRLPAVGDDPVDPRVTPDREPERRQRVPPEEETVQRVHTLVRLGRRVGGLSRELDVEVHHRQHQRVDLVAVAWVIHERGRDVPKDSRLDEVGLAVAPLLGGTAEQTHASANPVERLAEREERADRRRPHEVVAARVSDAGKRVVLAEDRDDRLAAPGLGDECGVESADAAPRVDPFALEIRAQRVRGEALLEGELGPRVDLEREAVQRVAARVDALADPPLAVRGAHAPRLTRTRDRTRGEHQLGEQEAGDDEATGHHGQPIHRAKQREDADERTDPDPATQRAPAGRLTPAWPSQRGRALLEGQGDERGRAG